MFTTHQQLMLRTAARASADTRKDEIDKVIELLKLINHEAFHTPKTLKTRKFFDEPTSLPLEDFESATVLYNHTKQHEMFARRDAVLLKL